jgi:hypothetical protein
VCRLLILALNPGASAIDFLVFRASEQARHIEMIVGEVNARARQPGIEHRELSLSRSGNTSTPRQRSPPLWAHPRDIFAQTQTPAAQEPTAQR